MLAESTPPLTNFSYQLTDNHSCFYVACLEKQLHFCMFFCGMQCKTLPLFITMSGERSPSGLKI